MRMGPGRSLVTLDESRFLRELDRDARRIMTGIGRPPRVNPCASVRSPAGKSWTWHPAATESRRGRLRGRQEGLRGRMGDRENPGGGGRIGSDKRAGRAGSTERWVNRPIAARRRRGTAASPRAGRKRGRESCPFAHRTRSECPSARACKRCPRDHAEKERGSRGRTGRTQ